MASETTIDLALHVVRTDAGIHGTLAASSGAGERFEGWLDLLAAIARTLEAAEGGTQ